MCLQIIFTKHNVEESFLLEGKEGDSLYKSIPIYLKTDIKSIELL
jgi:hypothetical protein